MTSRLFLLVLAVPRGAPASAQPAHPAVWAPFSLVGDGGGGG